LAKIQWKRHTLAYPHGRDIKIKKLLKIKNYDQAGARSQDLLGILC